MSSDARAEDRVDARADPFGGLGAYARDLLTGERVRLRPLREADLPDLERWWQDLEPMVGQRLAVLPQPTGAATELFRRWSANTDAGSVGFSVVDRDGDALVGHLTLHGATVRGRCAELAVMVGAEHVGRGLGTDAVRTALRYAFDELGLHRVELRVMAFNARALAAYRRAGLQEEGRRREVHQHGGRWYDEVGMGVLAREWRAARAGQAAP